MVEGITGWNPNNTLVGQFVTESLNPGYYISPSHIVNGLSNITKGVGNVLSKDYVIPFGFRSVANDGQVTNQLNNFRSNYLTRSTINKVLRNNPNLNSEYRENLVEAAKNMVYTKPVDGSHRMYMTFNGETPRMTPDGIFQYNMEIPRYDRWSNLHEIGHFVDDATGLPSSNLQRIPGYRRHSWRGRIYHHGAYGHPALSGCLRYLGRLYRDGRQDSPSFHGPCQDFHATGSQSAFQ